VPVHGSTRYIKHQSLEIRSATRIEWGEGVSWSSNLERSLTMDDSQRLEQHQRRLTAAHNGADSGLPKPAPGLSEVPFYTQFGPTGVAHRGELT
jgi:hypothetical protein